MSKMIKQFPFYITYVDVAEYCFWMVDTYGEDSQLVKLIDSGKFMEQCDNPQKYKKNADEILMGIRQCLFDNGFEPEIRACDKAFATERRMKRGNDNPYIPVGERWEKEIL